MAFWREDEDAFMGLACTEVLHCPFDGSVYELYDAKLLNFSLRQDGVWDSHAIDVLLRCPHCGYIDIYGVAVSKEHWEKTRGNIEGYMKDNEDRYEVYKVISRNHAERLKKEKEERNRNDEGAEFQRDRTDADTRMEAN